MTVEEILKDELSLFAIPLYLAAVALESLWSRRRHLGWYRGRDTLVSLTMLLAAALVELLPKILALLLMIQLHDISPLRDVIDRQWWAWVLLFFLDDFSYYWFHRANHEVRLFWAGHVNHHSSQYMNFGTALRQGVGERVHKFLFWLWLPLLGFDPAMIITIISINLFYQFWVQGAPRLQYPLPGLQSRRRPYHLGSPVRHLQPRSGRGTGCLRIDQKHRRRQRADCAGARVPVDLAGRKTC
jgi:hypothetical protein